jgi:hypothetical protein
VGKAKTQGLTQGMINLAVECQPDGEGSFVCRPSQAVQCFFCHAVSVSASTLSLIDLAEMKKKRGSNEILGHSCLTCHPPRGEKDHHLEGNIRAITIRASEAFKNGCGGCHAEGLAKITGGGSPHDWLARHLDDLPNKDEGVDK